MRNNKRLNSFLAILCSILILGYSTPGAFAKKTRATLQLRSVDVNASVIDPSKNVLTIEGASNIDPTVSIKPSKRTLKNGKPVNIEGELNEDGSLEVDLSALGPANLIPSGTYIVLARQGKKKLKATFNYNAPTLLVGRLIVPVPASDELKARVLRYQTEGEPLPIDAEARDATVFPTNNHEPIEGAGSLAVPGTPIIDEETGAVSNFYQVFGEVPADQIDNIELLVLKAQVEAQTATGETEEITLSTVAFTKNANPNNNIVPSDVDATTSAATNVITALLTEIKDTLPDGGPLQNLPPLDDAFQAIKDVVGPALDSGETIDAQLTGTEAALQVLPTDVYKGIANNIDGIQGLNDNQVGSIAGEITFKAPELVDKPPTDLITKEDGTNPINDILFNTNALGYFQEGELDQNVPKPPIELQANALDQAGVVIGSLQPDTSESGGDIAKAKADAIKSGTVPLAIVSENAVATFAKIKEAFDSGAIGGTPIDPSKFSAFPLPPGAKAEIGKLASAIASSLGSGISFDAKPGSFLEGTLPPGVDLFAAAGVFMPPGIAALAKAGSGEFRGTFPPGFAPSGKGFDGTITAGFIPSTFTGAFAGPLGASFGIFDGTGKTESVSGNLFALETGKAGSTPTPSGGPIAFFDPTKDGAKISAAFESLGGKASEFFGSAAVALAGAFTKGAPPIGAPGTIGGPSPFVPAGLFDLAGAATKGFSGGGVPLPPTFTFGTGGFDPTKFDGSAGSGAGIFAGGKGGSGGTFPGGGATGGTFPGGGATGGTFPGGGTPPPDGFVPPPDGGTQPPPDGGTQPPPDGGTQPPPDGEFQPPPDGGTQPPPDGGTQPPPDGGTQPPPDGEFQPPPDGGTQPPPDGGTQPPPDGTFQPPPDGSAPPPPPPDGSAPPPPPPEEPPPPPPEEPPPPPPEG